MVRHALDKLGQQIYLKLSFKSALMSITSQKGETVTVFWFTDGNEEFAVNYTYSRLPVQNIDSMRASELRAVTESSSNKLICDLKKHNPRVFSL